MDALNTAIFYIEQDQMAVMLRFTQKLKWNIATHQTPFSFL